MQASHSIPFSTFCQYLSGDSSKRHAKQGVLKLLSQYAETRDRAPNWYQNILDEVQKRMCGTVGPSITFSLEPLAHCRNVASLSSLFCRYYFDRYLCELAKLVPLPHSHGRSTRDFNWLYDFSVSIPRCCNDVYVNIFFPCTSRLWNSLPVECIPLTYSLNGFKCRVNHLFFLRSSWTVFLYPFHLFLLFLQLYTLQWLFSLVWSET